jgi:hypothetical protein
VVCDHQRALEQGCARRTRRKILPLLPRRHGVLASDRPLDPHQTDAAFGYTPDAPFGVDNIHMAQGDPREVNIRLHENGVWHDGACFIWDEVGRRMTAIFLAFQSQGWHTNDSGDLIFGATGCEAPTYDYSKEAGTPLPLPRRVAEITSAHRAPDGTASVVVANMGTAPLDLAGWRFLIDTVKSFPLPETVLPAGQPLSAPLPAGSLSDSGGLLTLVNSSQLRVDGVAYAGGDPQQGWSTSFG